MHHFLKVMADHDLDAIVLKTNEHQPTLIEDGTKPPFVNTKGAWFLNTFLVYVPVVAVPAGFTVDDLPVGITFMGRPYDDGTMLKLAYAYEQATHHRRSPSTTPALHEERGLRQRIRCPFSSRCLRRRHENRFRHRGRGTARRVRVQHLRRGPPVPRVLAARQSRYRSTCRPRLAGRETRRPRYGIIGQGRGRLRPRSARR